MPIVDGRPAKPKPKKKKRNKPGDCLAIGIILMVLALAGFITGAVLLYNDYETKSWPTAKGVIKSSDVHREVRTSKNEETGQESTTTYFTAMVKYEYRIKGKKYTASNVSYDYIYGIPESKYAGEATEIINRYPEDKKVTVYYNPDDPNEALLEPGTSTTWKWTFIIGGVFAVISIIALASYPRAKRKAALAQAEADELLRAPKYEEPAYIEEPEPKSEKLPEKKAWKDDPYL